MSLNTCLSGAQLARRSEAPNTDALRSSLLADFAAIEEERRAVDADLAVARLEATKSTAFLADQEAQARHVESRERLRLEGEHSARMSKLSAELEAVREELDIRTRVIAGELARWRAQAEAAASAVRDAKDELRDRQREVDLTKGRMDGLVELLYLGRERTVELTRASPLVQRQLAGGLMFAFFQARSKDTLSGKRCVTTLLKHWPRR